MKKVSLPIVNEKLVLQENGEDEEDNAFSCHCKQILPHKVPLKGVKSLFASYRWAQRGGRC